MNVRVIGILSLTIFIASGCVESRTIEDIGIMNVYGIDQVENGKVNTTATFYQFRSQENAKIVAGQGDTLMEGQKHMNYKLDFLLDPSSIKLELFGKSTAEDGINNYLEQVSRSIKASKKRLLAVSNTTANGLMTKTKKSTGANVNRALSHTIDLNNKQDILPRMTLHEFQRMYYEQGVDPTLPILSYQDERPKLRAIALFQNDKMVGQIPIDQAFYINMLHHNIHDLKQEVPLPFQPFKKYLQEKPQKEQKNLYTSLNIQKGTSKTKLVDKQQLAFHTQLNFDVELLELTEDVNMQRQDASKTLKREIEKAMKEQYTKLLTTLQKQNVDPMGYGQIYEAKEGHNAFTDSEWRDKFPNINVDIDVNVDIRNHGEI